MNSHKTKRPRKTVMAAAQHVMEWLTPNCERIQVAGSLRRQSADGQESQFAHGPVAHTE